MSENILITPVKRRSRPLPWQEQGWAKEVARNPRQISEALRELEIQDIESVTDDLWIATPAASARIVVIINETKKLRRCHTVPSRRANRMARAQQ